MHVSEGQSGTGNWVWKNQAYNDWDIADRSSILWIQGKPGSGKSTLSKQILGKLQMKHSVKSHAEIFNESSTSADSEKTNNLQHRLQRNTEARGDTTIIAGFFYNRRGGQTETKHAQMLHSLLFQVLQQDSRLFTSFQEVYRNLRENSGNMVSWSYDDLRTIFSNLMTFDKFPLRIYFVVDAIDESDEGERAGTLSLLSNACSESAPCIIKSIIASRSSPDIRMIFEDPKDCYQIVLENENRRDIEKVVEAGLVPIKEALGSCSSDFQFVYSYLIENSHGVFLWVVLVMRKVRQYVRDGATGDGIKMRLKDIPEDLYSFYSDIIKKLKARDKYDIAEAIDMLTWASFTARPLEVREFGDAIAISAASEIEHLDITVLKGKRYRNPDHLRKGIKSRSGGLLEVTIPKTPEHFSSKVQPQDSAGTEIVQLLHQTVKDFLLTEENTAPFNANVAHGDRVIASVCTRYLVLSLSYTNFPEDIVKETEYWELPDYECFVRHLEEDRPLLNYALSCLPLHLNRLRRRKDPAQKTLLKSLQQIQEQPEKYCSCLLALWLGHYGYASPAMQQMDYARNFVNTTLVTASKHGFTGMVKSTIEAKASVDGFDEKNASSPLVAAAKSGRCEVAKILIENGATLDLSLEARGTALHAAIAAGDISMVKLLLMRGASTGARDSGESSALTAAANAENHDIVKLLTDMGADISARDERGWTALHRVVGEGKKGMVELLVASGVPANALTNDGLTALHLAEANQDGEMINVLLEQERVDANAKDWDGRTPLSRAVENEHKAMVELLLEQERVDPNAKDYDGRTPLLRAVENEYKAMVELLLEQERVDPNAKDNNGRTALLRAVENGREVMVELLLEQERVDANAEDWGGRTALLRAVENGREAMVELLLERERVNPNVKDKDGRTALLRAVENGGETVVELLLEQEQVDPNIKDKDGRTALLRAVENEHEAMVELLLKQERVDLNVKDNDGRAPLSWAAGNGHETVVKLLLEKAVDIESNDNYGRTPLWWAAGNGREAVAKLLLEKAVNIDSKDTSYGRTPLSRAAGNGHKAVVKLLLEKAVDVDSKDIDGRTPLSRAVWSGYEMVVKLLLEKAVDVDSKDINGQTPLTRASRSGHEAVVRLLLKKAVDIDSKDKDGRTSLSWAAGNGHEAVVRLLLKKAVDVDSKDTSYGRTPLSRAAGSGHAAVVKLLLKKAVDVDSKDIYGETPLSRAAQNKHEVVVKLLKLKAQ
jgi:ankyrin repeat protein